MFTYEHPSDFLRQVANSNGKIDVICVSSFLVKSLVRSRWLKSVDYASLPNMKLISVDFSSLPYDPEGRYTVPLFWNLYGFFGKGETPGRTSWKQTWESKKVTLWGEELNLLNLMNVLKLNQEAERNGEAQDQSEALLASTFKKFSRGTIDFFKPQGAAISAEAMVNGVDWIQLPLSRVARLLGNDSPYHFWLPEEGAAIEVGVLGIGERATQPELAKALINELINTPHAIQTHTQLNMGVVHSSMSGLGSIAKLQKPEAIREFPLTQFSFPDLDVQDLPRFQKIFDESIR